MLQAKIQYFLKFLEGQQLFYTLLTTVIYYDKLISTRKWQDIYNPEWKKNSINATLLDKRLKGLKWISNNPNTRFGPPGFEKCTFLINKEKQISIELH